MGLVTAQSVHPVPSLYFDEDKLSADVTSEPPGLVLSGSSTSDFLPRFADLSRGAAQKLGIARVATEVLKTLPGFTTATLDEVRDIRTALAPHLAGFRKGVTEIALSIEAQPWDPSFPHEVDRELQLRLQRQLPPLEPRCRRTPT